MQSVWVCTGTDVIGNALVFLAAITVGFTHSIWPDLVIASIMALMGVMGSAQICKKARAELIE